MTPQETYDAAVEAHKKAHQALVQINASLANAQAIVASLTIAALKAEESRDAAKAIRDAYAPAP